MSLATLWLYPEVKKETPSILRHLRTHHLSCKDHKPPESKQSDLEGILGKFIEESRANFRNQEAINRDIQNQLGQLSRQIAERTQGSLPSDTINPKEHVKAITLRSGKELDGQHNPSKLSDFQPPQVDPWLIV